MTIDRATEQQNLITFGLELGREFAKEIRIELVVEVSDNDRDDPRPAGNQRTGNGIRPVTQRLGRFEDLLTGRLGDTRSRSKCARDSRLRDTSSASDLVGG